MKKKWIRILSLAMACMMCGSFYACDGIATESVLDSVLDSVVGGSSEIASDSDLDGSSDSSDVFSSESVKDENSDIADSQESVLDSESSEDVVDSESAEDSASDSADEEDTVAELSVHFLALGNKTSGDCTLIKTGDTEILIDAGSTTGSIGTIVPYIKQYCTDGVLEYVIATHGDQDHIAGFTNSSSQGKGIFESFVCETIIDFPKTTKSTAVYNEYVSLRDAEVAAGATHYTALECWNNENGAQRSYQLADGITMNILYQKYYEVSTSTENNYSVCMMISQNENHYLFTGDLESSGEASLLENNNLPKCKLYKSAHHGSNTSNTSTLLSVIQPEIVVITCCCGDKFDFPHQETIDTIARYTSLVYVPSMVNASGSYTLLNGNVVVTSVDGKTATVNCSNNNTLFKDTDWFKNNRTLPNAWKN